MTVQAFPDIFSKIIPFFNKNPILTVKEKDFNDFKLAADIIKSKLHLTPEGLARLRVLKAKMNKNRIII